MFIWVWCDMNKTTLHGVSSASTKEVFKDLKKRGFKCHLEKGSNSTFKIISSINGVKFAISCVDGKEKLYSKSYNRGSRKWKEFEYVDQLILISMVKATSKPTDGQLKFFNSLIRDIKSLTDRVLRIKPPLCVSAMCDAIDEAKWLLMDLKLGCYVDQQRSYVNLS